MLAIENPNGEQLKSGIEMKTQIFVSVPLWMQNLVIFFLVYLFIYACTKVAKGLSNFVAQMLPVRLSASVVAQHEKLGFALMLFGFYALYFVFQPDEAKMMVSTMSEQLQDKRHVWHVFSYGIIYFPLIYFLSYLVSVVMFARHVDGEGRLRAHPFFLKRLERSFAQRVVDYLRPTKMTGDALLQYPGGLFWAVFVSLACALSYLVLWLQATPQMWLSSDNQSFATLLLAGLYISLAVAFVVLWPCFRDVLARAWRS
jgi:hypothetical protein